ncbi:phosphoribosylamine--glycine ligase [Candidatus Roizmanbacteria bacterium]|nr:phosphoribosylamine--glycine ligase [Candidatus Roizmanbacteria bacterium]
MTSPDVATGGHPDVYIPSYPSEQNVMILGNGGRESALTWIARQDPQTGEIFVVPGNGGTEDFENTYQVGVDPNNHALVAEAARDYKAGLVIVGPEEPLVRGSADYLSEHGILVYGPTQEMAQLEGSKAYAVDFMRQFGIPHPHSVIINSYEQGARFLGRNASMKNPWFKDGIVVKADGLAAGKGVFVCHTYEEAQEALRIIMRDKSFGDAGNRVVLQEKLEGFELSAIAVCADGKYRLLPMTEDHKQAEDGDKGPNTGGMGVVTPHPEVTPEMVQQIEETIIQPTLTGVHARLGEHYRGTLYVGIMWTPKGPRVLEYNVRKGDPETQVQLVSLEDVHDFMFALYLAAQGRMDRTTPFKTKQSTLVGVTLASRGYPGPYEKGTLITGVAEAQELPGVTIFHAGTKRENDQLVTSGGRVLYAVGEGETVKDAKEKAYTGVKTINFEGKTFRTDIPRPHR